MSDFTKDYHHIKIYKRIIFWWHVATIYNNDPSLNGMELYRQTRDHYKRLWVYTRWFEPANICFKLVWDNEVFDGNSKRIE